MPPAWEIRMAREPLKSPESTQPAAVGPRDTSLPLAPTQARHWG